jgi:hypothetical protein
MWDDLMRHLRKYPTAVLTVMDVDGYPFSIRCVPETDEARQVLRVGLPGYVHPQAGPAGLLCHFHDDLLWKQTNFIARGTLEPDGHNWIFTPVRLIEGAGAGMSLTRQLRNGRRSAKRYLERRELSRPRVPWAHLSAIYKRAQEK